MFLALAADLTTKAGPPLQPPTSADADGFRAVLASLRRVTLDGAPATATSDEEPTLERQDNTADETLEHAPQDGNHAAPAPEIAETLAFSGSKGDVLPHGDLPLRPGSMTVDGAVTGNPDTAQTPPVSTPMRHSDPVLAVPSAPVNLPQVSAPSVIDSGLATLAQLPERTAPVQEAAVAMIANPRVALWQGRLSLGAMPENPGSQRTQSAPALVEGANPIAQAAPLPGRDLLVATQSGTPPELQKSTPFPVGQAQTPPFTSAKPEVPASSPIATPDLAPTNRIALVPQMAGAPQSAAPLDAAIPDLATTAEGALANIATSEGRTPGHAQIHVTPFAPEPAAQISQTAQSTPPRSAEVAQNIAQQISARITPSGADGFEVALAPDELGAVRLRLQSTEAGSVLIVQADRPETMDLMRRHIATLEHELRSLGHDALTVRFAGNGSGDGSSNAQNGGSESHSAPHDDAPEQTRPSPRATVADDHLDLRL